MSKLHGTPCYDPKMPERCPDYEPDGCEYGEEGPCRFRMFYTTEAECAIGSNAAKDALILMLKNKIDEMVQECADCRYAMDRIEEFQQKNGGCGIVVHRLSKLAREQLAAVNAEIAKGVKND